MYPNSIKNLIECFKNLPGVGEKSAERMAFTLIEFDKEKLEYFSNSINVIKNEITRCSICNNLIDSNGCLICNDSKRPKNKIFVVEKPKDIILFEKIGSYKGLYHVLDGLISPLEGKGPEDININSLINRIKDGNVDEVILALKPSIEGETTSQYINKMLEKLDIKVTKIATGIPMGTEIEYIDPITLELALEERKSIS